MSSGDAAVAGQGQAQGDGGGEGQAQQGPDLGAIAEQLTGMAESQEQMRQYLASNPWAQQEQQQGDQQQEQQQQDLDLSFLEDPSLTQEQLAQQLTGLIDSSAEQRAQSLLQQHINPLSKQVADMRLESQAERLVQEFPEMAEPETAEKVVSTARQYAEMMGRPDLANDPAFWRLTYLAGRAADQANAEQSDEPQPAHLEGAGGAGPGGQQVDWAKQIVNGGDETALGKRALPFG